MNINSILSTLRMSSISTDYNVAKSNLISKKSTQDLMDEDVLASNKSSVMPRESYDYSSKFGMLNLLLH